MLLPVRMRFYLAVILTLVGMTLIHYYWPPVLWFLIILLPLIAIGFYDIFQTKSNILRNYPIWGHVRYILLSFRPQIQQYFIINDQDDRPFNKEMRDLVTSRSDRTTDTLPFGTQLDMDKPGYEWMAHSLRPCKAKIEGARVVVGNAECTQPYYASRINISALSFGALSQNAIRALNRGAKIGGFAHNTGEGGLSRYHLMEGGDIIWQIGTGYFGCRNEDGTFCEKNFEERALNPNVKMIEIKLSQGAKPAHGGILPGVKVTEEIAKARGVPEGVSCNSPPAHSAFSTPKGLIEFVQRLRDLSGGKPVGFKLCMGVRSDFLSICKAMLEFKIYPDFIAVDGAEGGTGFRRLPARVDAPLLRLWFVGLPVPRSGRSAAVCADHRPRGNRPLRRSVSGADRGDRKRVHCRLGDRPLAGRVADDSGGFANHRAEFRPVHHPARPGETGGTASGNRPLCADGWGQSLRPGGDGCSRARGRLAPAGAGAVLPAPG